MKIILLMLSCGVVGFGFHELWRLNEAVAIGFGAGLITFCYFLPELLKEKE